MAHVRWLRREGSMVVRWFDAFAPGTAVHEATLPLVPSWEGQSIQVDIVAARGADVRAIVLAASRHFLLRAGAEPADLDWGTTPSAAALGADGAMVLVHANPVAVHFSPDRATRTEVDVPAGAVIASLDATGFTFVQASAGSAARARIAAGRPPSPLAATALERVDRLGWRVLLDGPRCKPDMAGEHFQLGGVRLVVRVDDDEPDLREATLDVIDYGQHACLAGIAADNGWSTLRVDTASGKADRLRADLNANMVEMQCALEP